MKNIKIKDPILNVFHLLIASFTDIHMDTRAMEFEDGSFDVAIDKGTLDALLVLYLKIK
jgi:hypothetical protein